MSALIPRFSFCPRAMVLGWGAAFLSLISLAAMGAWSYALFHGLVELLIFAVTGVLFAQSWDPGKRLRGDPLILITRSLLWVAVLRAVHIVTFNGLPLSPLGDIPIHDLSIRFSFAARFVTALAFLAYALSCSSRRNWAWIMAGLGFVSGGLAWIAVSPVSLPAFPPALNPFTVEGPTIKAGWETVLAGLALLSMVLVARVGALGPKDRQPTLLWVMGLFVASQVLVILPVISLEAQLIAMHLLALSAFFLLYWRLERERRRETLIIPARRWEERRAFEARLLEEKERAERFLDIAEAMIVGLDKRGQVTVVNAHACAVLGWSESELVGADWFSLVVPADCRERDRALFCRTLAGTSDQGRFLETDVMVRDGRVLRFSWHHLVTRNARGEVTGSLSSGRDVTDQKRVRDALMEAKETAEEANRAKSDFLASVSHELRTPLNAVIGFSEAMEAEILGPIENPTYRDYVSNIRVSGTHLLDLINDILDVSAIEAGKLDPRRETVDPDRVVRVALEMVRGRAESKHLTLVGEPVPGEAVRLIADERRFRQMVVNLLGNAVKFTPNGGSVTLRFTRSEGEMAFGLSVIDTGPGMSPEDLALAMRPFGRVIDPKIPWREGTGLGLPLVEGLIGAHGGRLEMDTAPGEGTRATLWFPRDRVVAPPDTPKTAPV
ncbi:MAG: PAS domain S-box protein [Rhodospirillum sp.]|nr:PAS domain S-box protein [Rhodospirillum sp.]MCF8491980.1 PAS domain S-box protein [Rhodospirillum sp.]MCF8501322.1 PAS domain S-box protein [Rhodospirillum sp.]